MKDSSPTPPRRNWGSIRKRSAATYEIRYTAVINGEKCRRCETVRCSYAQATKRLDQLWAQYGAPQDSAHTVNSFWSDVYLPECERRLALSTVNGYKQVFAHNIAPAFGSLTLDALTPLNVQDWLDSLTYGVAKNAHALLRAMYNRAYNLDLIAVNVMSKHYYLPAPALTPARSRDVYTAQELEELFLAVRGEIFEAAFILSAFGGASREEAVGVQLEDVGYIDTPQGVAAVVEIRRGVQRIGGRVQVMEKTKTPTRRRSLVILPPYSLRLCELAGANKAAGLVWLTDDGTGAPLCPNRMAMTYKRWFLSRPFRYVPFSNLRNSYATALHAAGLDLFFVGKLLGHTQPVTTYKHYTRPTVEQILHALQAVADMKNAPRA